MSGGRNRFFAYNSARRGSSGLKLGGLVGLFGPVRTRPAPTSWAVRFRCHGGICPKLCLALPRRVHLSQPRLRPTRGLEVRPFGEAVLTCHSIDVTGVTNGGYGRSGEPLAAYPTRAHPLGPARSGVDPG